MKNKSDELKQFLNEFTKEFKKRMKHEKKQFTIEELKALLYNYNKNIKKLENLKRKLENDDIIIFNNSYLANPNIKVQGGNIKYKSELEKKEEIKEKLKNEYIKLKKIYSYIENSFYYLDDTQIALIQAIYIEHKPTKETMNILGFKKESEILKLLVDTLKVIQAMIYLT